MKHPLTPLLAIALAGFSFSSCGSKDQVEPQDKPAADTNASAATNAVPKTPFYRVMDRLDVGGKMLEIQDHEGRREMALGLAEMMVGTSMAGMPEEKIDIPALLDSLGVGRSAASGRSVSKDGDAWLLKSYAYQPKGRRGLETLLGNASAPFLAPETLPATVDLVVEARLDISALPDLMTDIAKAVGQEEAATGFLKKDLPSGGPLLDLLGQSKLHIIVGIDVSSWEQADGTNHLDFFIRIDGGKMALQSLQPQFVQALGEPEMLGKVRQWQVPIQALSETPALLLADEDGTLTLASTKAYLEAAQGTGGKLAADTDFLSSTNHFPKAGNLLLYASRETPPFLATMFKQMVVPQVEKEIAPLLAKATDYLEARPWSLSLAHEPDGSSMLCEMPLAFDGNLGVALPMLSATSVLFIGARSWKDGSDRATCVMNIRNAQTGMRSYENLNGLKTGDTIPWDKIYSPDFMQTNKPVCPTGGTYTFATTFPDVGVVGCQCSNPEHKPTNHENW